VREAKERWVEMVEKRAAFTPRSTTRPDGQRPEAGVEAIEAAEAERFAQGPWPRARAPNSMATVFATTTTELWAAAVPQKGRAAITGTAGYTLMYAVSRLDREHIV
jgi:hypothetical protein